MTTSNGRFVWYDLMTTDLAGAKKFYGDLIGWKLTKWGGADYEMWTTADGKTVGGLMQLPQEAQSAGAPPHWLAYAQTADVDATARKAAQLGGQVMVPGTDIPNVGRFAVLADPQGAVFAIFKPNDAGDGPNREAQGNFSWAELNTTDYEAAWKFYSELLGWQKTSAMDIPEFGVYFMFGTDPEQSMGGMSNAAKMMNAPAHWLHYINVRNCDETAKVIPAKGGKVLNGPIDVPGGVRIAQGMDPQGGFFALYASGAK